MHHKRHTRNHTDGDHSDIARQITLAYKPHLQAPRNPKPPPSPDPSIRKDTSWDSVARNLSRRPSCVHAGVGLSITGKTNRAAGWHIQWIDSQASAAREITNHSHITYERCSCSTGLSCH